jgi:hypothetical protein
MASTFKLSTLLQNSYAASAVRAPIRHSVPDINVSLADQWSVAAEFTGTGSNVIGIVAGPPLRIQVGGVTQIDPITRSQIAVAKVKGFIVYVGKTSPSVTETGNVTLTTAGFGSTTITSTVLPNGSVFAVHLPIALAAVAAQTLTINLATTTNYKVSVVAYGEADAEV